MSINAQLQKLYVEQENNGTLELLHNKYSDELDGPLLMYCWEDEYLKAAPKILFVGQEHTQTYWFANDAVKSPIEWYQNFRLGENNNYVFWKHVKKLNTMLNPEGSAHSFLWTNVSKYCTSEGNAIKDEDHEFIISKMNLLQHEIEIIKPDIVIFLSGFQCDKRLSIQFDGEVQFEKIFEFLSKNDLARVSHEKLPYNSFRTFHPRRLLKNCQHYLKLLCAKIWNCDLNKFYSELQTNGFLLQEEWSKFGSKETSMIYKTDWKNFDLLFQFQAQDFNEFCYGIRKKDGIILEENQLQKFSKELQHNRKEGSEWVYFSECAKSDWNYTNWNKETFEDIKSGVFIKNIISVAEELVQKALTLNL